MRNIQINLVQKWSSSTKVSELIDKLPDFCDNFEYQIKEGLLPNIGEYSINDYTYNINDFLSNLNNYGFKIKAPVKNEKNEIIFYDKYLLITNTTFLLLGPVDEKFKNICVINFVGNLYDIFNILNIQEDDEVYENYDVFRFKWNKNSSNNLVSNLCSNKNGNILHEIKEEIISRRDQLLMQYKYIEKSENLSIDIYEKIIEIKSKLVANKTNDAIYEDINKLYQKIIEILSSKSDNNDFQKYLDKLKKFISDYDKLKIEEKKRSESQNSNNKNGSTIK